MLSELRWGQWSLLSVRSPYFQYFPFCPIFNTFFSAVFSIPSFLPYFQVQFQWMGAKLSRNGGRCKKIKQLIQLTPHNDSRENNIWFYDKLIEMVDFFWSKRIVGPHDCPILYELTHRSRSMGRRDGNKYFDNPPPLTCMLNNGSQAQIILLNQNLQRQFSEES